MRSTKKISLAVMLTITAIAACSFTLLEYTLYAWAYSRGWNAARVSCPEEQRGERLRYVEQPFDERVAVCVYGRAYAVVSVKRNAK